MKPRKPIVDEDDAWFYTKEWQEGEAEVDRDIAAGRVSGPFSTVDELIRSLHGKTPPKGARKSRPTSTRSSRRD